MGKLEKIVVLGVLFLISLIIVLSLSTGGAGDAADFDDGTPQLSGELRAAADPDTRIAKLPVDRSPETSTSLERPRPMSPAAPVSDGLAVETPGRRPNPASPGLLSSSVAADQAQAAEAAAERVPSLRLEADWDLKSVQGLERSNHPAFLIHRCARGETFEGIARGLYGDAAKADLLRRNNEGIQGLQDGLEILVPVRDDRGPDAGDYVVQEGESLWVIAKRFYGQGSRWGEIFEANRDVLDTPEAVRTGMKLQIP